MGFFEIFFDMIMSMTTPEIYEQFPLSRFLFSAIAVIFAVVILALFVITAVLSKKQRIIGILAGVATFISTLTIPTFIKTWHNLFAPIRSLIGSSATIEMAQAALVDALIALAIVLVVTAIMLVSVALTIVFVAKSFKNKPVICAIGALALVILRQLWVAPFPMMVPMIAKAFLRMPPTSSFFLYDQIFQLCAYFGILVLALILVLIPVIIKKIKGEKVLKAVEAAEEAPATEEAPASEEAPKADEAAE